MNIFRYGVLQGNVTHGDRNGPDVLRDVFVSLGERVNVNTNQIITVKGRLDKETLARAFKAAVREVPVMCSRLDIANGVLTHDIQLADQARVEHMEWGGECSLSNEAFRRVLMKFSHLNRVKWGSSPPVQLLLVTALDGKSSCVYMSSHHAAADARSDCLLLERIIKHYSFLSGVSSCAPDPVVLPFENLSALMPGFNGRRARLRRFLLGVSSLLVGFVNGGVGLAVGRRGSRWRTVNNDSDVLDFYHQQISESDSNRFHSTARSFGVTLNTLICSALLRVMASVQTPSTLRHRSRVMCAVSLRRIIGDSVSDSVRNYLLPVDIVADGRLPANQLVQYVQHAMNEARKPGAVESVIGKMEILNWLMKVNLSPPILHWLIDIALGTNASYSNPGVIEQDFSEFGGDIHATTGYIGFGCLVPPYDFILYTPTVNGRLSLDLVYRKQVLQSVSEELAAPILEAIESLVSELEAMRSVE